MSLQADLIAKIKELPADKQLLVKSLVDQLARQTSTAQKEPSKPWFGCLEHLGIDVTEQDIAEARQEMWGEFPREVR